MSYTVDENTLVETNKGFYGTWTEFIELYKDVFTQIEFEDIHDCLIDEGTTLSNLGDGRLMRVSVAGMKE